MPVDPASTNESDGETCPPETHFGKVEAESPNQVGHLPMTPPQVANPKDREGRDRQMTTLTEPEMTAIHQLLQADRGLHSATGASEMLVTYPSRFTLHVAPRGALLPKEFENDDDESY